MTDSREMIRKELDNLVEQGTSLLKKASKDKSSHHATYSAEYQRWYTMALAVLKQLAPDRLREFGQLYKIEKRKQIDFTTYTISDYFLGTVIRDPISDEKVFDPWTVFWAKFFQQMAILKSVYPRLDSLLSDIKGVLRADLFDSEIDAARSLLEAKHLRAAGTIAGVVLENHLSAVCVNHQITIAKKNPTIAHYNDSLKNKGIFDVPTWRWIQRLADIRNMCCHAKDRDPTAQEVRDLIDGVEKATKTIF